MTGGGGGVGGWYCGGEGTYGFGGGGGAQTGAGAGQFSFRLNILEDFIRGGGAAMAAVAVKAMMAKTFASCMFALGCLLIWKEVVYV